MLSIREDYFTTFGFVKTCFLLETYFLLFNLNKYRLCKVFCLFCILLTLILKKQHIGSIVALGNDVIVGRGLEGNFFCRHGHGRDVVFLRVLVAVAVDDGNLFCDVIFCLFAVYDVINRFIFCGFDVVIRFFGFVVVCKVIFNYDVILCYFRFRLDDFLGSFSLYFLKAIFLNFSFLFFIDYDVILQVRRWLDDSLWTRLLGENMFVVV